MTWDRLKLSLTLQARGKSECFEANSIIKIKKRDSEQRHAAISTNKLPVLAPLRYARIIRCPEFNAHATRNSFGLGLRPSG
jgi:hypothetical protein